MSRIVRGVAAGALAVLTVVGVPAVADAAPVSEVVSISSTQKHLYVEWRGNGHGHGLSQWGAYNRAVAKQSYKTILSFYYPKTTLATLPTTTRIKVLISKAGATNAVNPAAKLTVTGISGALPTKGIKRYRLIAGATSGLVVQKLASAAGSAWKTIKTLPHNNTASFHNTDNSAVRLYLNDGTSTSYYGYLRAVRASKSSVQTIDDVSMEGYVEGVVPRESPASWPRAATDAQAVAARTYADYQERVDPVKPGVYDICDTTFCQVYGGHAHYSSTGALISTDFPQAANDTTGNVLRYNGAPVFAQFSASNGGWTADGGEPYLVAAQDTYDPRSPDPNIVTTEVHKIAVADLAKKFGLKTITEIDLARDGHSDGSASEWGGRIVSGVVKDGSTSVPFTDPTVFQQNVNSLVPDPYVVGTTWIQLIATS